MATSVLNAPPGFVCAQCMHAWRLDGSALIATVEMSDGQVLEIQLQAESPEVWHIRCAPADNFPEGLPLVIGSLGPAVSLDVQETAERLLVAGAALSLEINRDPWCLTFRDETGRVVCRENPYDVDGLGRLFVRPLGYIRGEYGQVEAMSESFHLRQDEHLFGLGEKFTPLDKTRQRIVCWTMDAFGSASERSHKNIPLLVSTRGYGLFLNTGRRSTWDLGTESCESYTLTVDGPYLDAYLIYGPTPAEVLERYARLTGQAPLPPRWSFGVWLSGGGLRRDQRSMQEMVDLVAEHDLPCDVIHVDTWWMRWRQYADFRWDRQAFPDPEAFAEGLHRKGLKLSVWQHPYISIESDLYAEGCRESYFVRRPSGEAYVIEYGLSLAPRPLDAVLSGAEQETWNAPVAIIDLTLPAAVQWYKWLMRPVLEGGVDVFKTDFGEDIPADAVFANGMNGAEMHNLYPLLYNQVVYEVTQEVKRAGLVWSRAGYAGSQRYPTCWSGDPAADFDSLACTIRGGLSIGLSGVPFWSNDIGGYRGLPSEQLYIRWAQFGLFCSHSRCHGESQREPWFFGPRSLDIFRRYADLRYRLFPYLYSTAHEANRTGLPVMRAMPLAFPHDPNCYDKDLQYMFGPWLLVAPVYDEGEERNVYLPEGQWINYWSGETFHGPANIRVAAPLEVLPMFVRGGAILPQIPPARRIPTGPIERLVVDVYPHWTSKYRLYEDESLTDFTCLSNDEGISFSWIGGAERPMLLRFLGIAEPPEVEVRAGEDGNALEGAQAGMATARAFEIHVPPTPRGWLRLRIPDMKAGG